MSTEGFDTCIIDASRDLTCALLHVGASAPLLKDSLSYAKPSAGAIALNRVLGLEM